MKGRSHLNIPNKALLNLVWIGLLLGCAQQERASRGDSAAAAAGPLAGLHASTHTLHRLRAQGAPSTLTPFVDALPIPATLQPSGKGNLYDVHMTQFRQKLHRDLPATTVQGYNGQYPGPTLDVDEGKAVQVRYTNDLPATALLPTDPLNMDGSMQVMGAAAMNPVRNVVHLHGGHVPAASDGHPSGVITPGQSVTYSYPNKDTEGFSWYHDHAMGTTRTGVYAGLEGLYFVRPKGDVEKKLNLPSGKYEVPLLIQDRSFDAAGQLVYPQSWAPETYGNVALVNGKVWPYLNVEPRKYRLRVLNGSNARFYHLTLPVGVRVTQIGSDGSLLERALPVTELTLAPAERADLIVDFSKLQAGDQVVLHNDAPAPYPNGEEPPLPDIMQFRVVAPTGRDTSSVPANIQSIDRLDPAKAARSRDFVLKEYVDGNDEPVKLLINDQPFGSAITDKPKLNSTEVWRFVNTTEDTHPMHVHLSEFQILDRRSFNAQHYLDTGEMVYTGPAVPPTPEEAGWKDTVRAEPGQVARVILRFKDHAGEFMLHCHILEHEDNDMMRAFEVVK